MASKQDPKTASGSGLPSVGGTEAASRGNLTYPPSLGAGDPSLLKDHQSDFQSPAPFESKLALDGSRADTLTGGDGSGDPGERGTGQGSLMSGAPLSSSLLIAILSDTRRAIYEAVPAIEEALKKLHIEDRMDLAVALSKLNHVLKGGAL